MADYITKQAPYNFTCPIYRITVKKGEECVEENGALFCMKILEERNLVLLRTPSACGHSPFFQGGENPGRKGNPFVPGTMRWDNLRMRLELETIALDPDGAAAKKILDKYRRKIKAREERYLSSQN